MQFVEKQHLLRLQTPILSITKILKLLKLTGDQQDKYIPQFKNLLQLLCTCNIVYSQNVRHFWTEGYKNPCFRNPRKHFMDHSPELLQCVPYFFVIGFPKCGTTDLFDRLSHHPEFIKPSFKEIHWISRYRFIPPKYDRLMFIAMNRTYRKL